MENWDDLINELIRCAAEIRAEYPRPDSHKALARAEEALRARITAQEIEIENLKRVTTMIPVSERLPDPGDFVNVYPAIDFMDGEKSVSTAYFLNPVCWYVFYGNGTIGDPIVVLKEITHWSPLPDPPESEKKK